MWVIESLTGWVLIGEKGAAMIREDARA